MSILFKALHKAAHDYRNQKAPIVIPLIKMPAAFDTKRRFRITVILLGCLFIMGLIASVFYSNAPVVQAQKPLVFIRSPAPSKVIQNEYENGIALDAGTLNNDKARQIKGQIDNSNALAVSKKKVSRSSLVVTHSGLSTTRQLEEAQYALEVSAWSKALKVYIRILNGNPSHQAALKGKIYALSQRGSDSDLIELERLVYKWPEKSSLHAGRALILAKQKRMTESLAAWARAYRLAPRHKGYGLGLAVTYDKLGRDREALKIYRSIPKPLSMGAQRRLDYLNAQFGHYSSEQE